MKKKIADTCFSPTFAGVLFHYDQLARKDYDQ